MKIVRVQVTEAEHKALRMLAAEKMWTMQNLIRTAVHDSPTTGAVVRKAATPSREKGTA